MRQTALNGDGVQDKPTSGFWQIWNMCFGFLGIQFGFALKNANTSRIFQTLGVELDTIAGLWIAAGTLWFLDGSVLAIGRQIWQGTWLY